MKLADIQKITGIEDKKFAHRILKAYQESLQEDPREESTGSEEPGTVSSDSEPEPLTGPVFSTDDVSNFERIPDWMQAHIRERIRAHNAGEGSYGYHREGVGGLPTMDLPQPGGTGGRTNTRIQFGRGGIRIVKHNNREIKKW